MVKPVFDANSTEEIFPGATTAPAHTDDGTAGLMYALDAESRRAAPAAAPAAAPTPAPAPIAATPEPKAKRLWPENYEDGPGNFPDLLHG